MSFYRYSLIQTSGVNHTLSNSNRKCRFVSSRVVSSRLETKQTQKEQERDERPLHPAKSQNSPLFLPSAHHQPIYPIFACNQSHPCIICLGEPTMVIGWFPNVLFSYFLVMFRPPQSVVYGPLHTSNIASSKGTAKGTCLRRQATVLPTERKPQSTLFLVIEHLFVCPPFQVGNDKRIRPRHS